MAFHICDAHIPVLDYIKRNPGCTKFAAAKAGTRKPTRCPSLQYYLVNTLIKHGYVLAVKLSNRYKLYSSDYWDCFYLANYSMTLMFPYDTLLSAKLGAIISASY